MPEILPIPNVNKRMMKISLWWENGLSRSALKINRQQDNNYYRHEPLSQVIIIQYLHVCVAYVFRFSFHQTRETVFFNSKYQGISPKELEKLGLYML